MNVRKLLEIPALYNLKTRLFSLGRANVWHYLKSLPPLPGDARVLDVGCGTGRHLALFGARGHGVDVQLEYIRYAHSHRSGGYSVMSAMQLSFADRSFDFVYAVGLLHHLDDEDARNAASEMRRVVRNGGQVLIIDALQPAISNPVGFVLAKLDRGEHLRRFEVLANLLAPVGFQPVLQNLPGSYPYERAVFQIKW